MDKDQQQNKKLGEKNIFLCGFMGCGKSTVGMISAKRLNMRFLDMDSFIEEQAGMTIPQIFEQQGEQGFRALEHQAVQTLSTRSGFVIPTGGGVVSQPQNIPHLKAGGIVVYINTPFALCYQRISASDRPLVKNRSRDELHQIYIDRRESYRAACDLEISGIGGSRAVVREILARLKAGV